MAAITPIPGKTNLGLVTYAKAQVGLPYWCGTYGKIASEALYQAKKKQLPAFYTANDFRSQFGKRVHDCIGLVKGYMWSASPTSPPQYNGSQDKGVEGMYKVCTLKGSTAQMNKAIDGLLVFNKTLGHVGVYCSNGKVYEAMGHAYGVVETTFNTQRWAYWGMCPYITYNDTPGTIYADTSIESLSKFLKYAGDQVGKDVTWTKSQVSVQANQSWNCAFVTACAKASGLIGVGFTNNTSAQKLLSTSISNKYGTFIQGPWSTGNAVVPIPGDIILIRTGAKSKYVIADKYTVSYIGIVYKVDKDGIHVVAGDQEYRNKAHVVKSGTFATGNKVIYGYYRPNWAIASTTSQSAAASYTQTSTNVVTDNISSLPYNSVTVPQINPADYALVREITENSDGIKLSIINYVSPVVQQLGKSASEAQATINYDKIENGTARLMFQYLLNKSMTPSQIIGILTDIYWSCKFQINQTSNGVGMLRWYDSRKKRFIKDVNMWRANLSGQLEFMWNELNNFKESVLKSLLNVTDISVDAAIECANIMHNGYHDKLPSSIDGWVNTRKYANTLWSQISIVQSAGYNIAYTDVVTTSTTSTSSSVATAATSTVMSLNYSSIVNKDIITQSGKRITSPVKEVLVPTWLKQTGITQQHTNYTYYWHEVFITAKSKQGLVAKAWEKEGKPGNRNIATVGGYYLCATTTKFGVPGDIMTVVLEDGTQINVMLGDSKGDHGAMVKHTGNVGYYWGSEFGTGAARGFDVIEWEKKGLDMAADYRVKGAPQIDLTGWANKKVAKIINWGTYFQ